MDLIIRSTFLTTCGRSGPHLMTNSISWHIPCLMGPCLTQVLRCRNVIHGQVGITCSQRPERTWPGERSLPTLLTRSLVAELDLKIHPAAFMSWTFIYLAGLPPFQGSCSQQKCSQPTRGASSPFFALAARCLLPGHNEGCLARHQALSLS